MTTEEFEQAYNWNLHRAQVSYRALGKNVSADRIAETSDALALVDLLVTKGIITDEEYKAASLKSIEQEVARLDKLTFEQLPKS